MESFVVLAEGFGETLTECGRRFRVRPGWTRLELFPHFRTNFVVGDTTWVYFQSLSLQHQLLRFVGVRVFGH